MKKTISSMLACGLFVSAQISLKAETSQPIVVTATRTAQGIDENLALVTVLTETDIQRSQARSLQDLLAGYAGMNFVNNGGLGKTTSLFLRGTNSGHVTVLVDGVKLGSATSGDIPFQNIPVSQIERIEIVRGPKSSLYGSEAIGGVIQIFTKQGKPGFRTNASVGYGSYETKEYSAGISGGSNNSTIQLNASSQQSEGFNARNGKNPDNDGYRNDSFSANLKQKFSESAELKLNILHAEGNNEYDGTTSTRLYENRFFQQSLGASLHLSPTSSWQSTLQLAQNRDENDFIRDDVLTSRYDTLRQQALWQNDLSLNENNLFTLGIDHQFEKIDSSTSFSKDERENNGVFIQHQYSAQGKSVIAGIRNDHNQAFGDYQTGNIALGFDINQAMNISLSYGTGFKAPTFNDLYFPGPFGAGNANLKPEESETSEVILKGTHWSAGLYKTQIKNLIVWTETSSFFYEPSNVDSATIYGLDLMAIKQIGDWQNKVDISFVDPRDDKTGKILPRRSRKTIRFSTDRTVGSFQFGTSIIGQGERYDDADNENRMTDYWLVDLRASYQLAKTWQLQAKVENLLNEEYETARGYNQPRQNVFVSINYQGL